MKRLTLNAILACVALAAGVITASGQMGRQAQVKFSVRQPTEGVASVSTVALGGVTNIKEVVNRTSYNVEVMTWERKGLEDANRQTRTIPPNGVWTGDMWVPWANNREELKDHVMVIEIEVPRPTGGAPYSFNYFTIWQTGEYVRSVGTNEDRRRAQDWYRNVDALFLANAPRVPGEARAGGERRIIISARNNTPVFRFERYNP
jgi:hypothetical protein